MSPQVKFKKLFEPGQLGGLRFKNRMGMPAMATSLSNVLGEVTDDVIEWYLTRARGGVGFITIEAAFTATQIDPLRMRQNFLRIDDDCYKPGWGRLANAIRALGAKVGVQLTPGMGSQARGGPWVIGRRLYEEVAPVSSSTVPSPAVRRQPRALTTWEVETLVESFGRAVARVAEVGFDFIEINAHSGHLIAQFLSPYFNKRTDKYGGDFDGRFRLLGEFIEVTHRTLGPDFPLVVKYSVDEAIEGGTGLKEGQKLAQYMERAGVTAITVSAGVHGARLSAVPPMYTDEGTFIPLANALRKVVKLPLLLPGRLGNPELAEKVLRDGTADFVLLGRPLIADPDLPRKLAEGRSREIRRCISCNECTTSGKGSIVLWCSVNPVAGMERWYGTLKPVEKRKKVMVIGAGPGGMEAARMAAVRGHSVTLCDRADSLGGQLMVASIPPHKETLRYIIDYYSEMFRQLSNVKLELKNEVTVAKVVKAKPDVVIVATGGEPIVPDIPGIEGSNVVTAHAVLAGKAKVGRTAVVCGGGLVGCETANFLAGQGKKVTIVEMLGEIGMGIENRVWLALKGELSAGGVRMVTGTRIDAVTGDGVTASDKDGHKILFGADTVVLALGMKSVNELAARLAGKVREVYSIGDAREPGLIHNAIRDGHLVARDL